MFHSENRKLIQAEKLIEEGKIEKARQVLNDFGKNKDAPYLERISYYTLKSRLAFYLIDWDECTKYAEKAYQESQKLENSLLLLDVYIQMTSTFLWQFKTHEESEFIKKSEDLLKTLPKELSKELTKRKAYVLWQKGVYYQQKVEFEKAKECWEESLAINEKLDLKVDIAICLFQLGQVFLQIGDLNRALEYTESGKTHITSLSLIRLLHQFYWQFGGIYYMKGELDRALSYFEQVLAFAEKKNDLILRYMCYNSIGMTYQEKGDFSRALENLEKSMSIAEEYGESNRRVNRRIFAVSDSLFHLALDMNDLEQAKRYLNQMKRIADKEKDQTSNLLYSIDKAIYLKYSPRALNRGKAEEILKQLIEEAIPETEFLKMALLNLCDLLLFELHATGEQEILDELHVYISQLFDAVKNSRSYSLLAETYLLEARLSLVTLDMIKARKFLTKAQEIAEKYGLNRLAIKISNEHDDLLKKLDAWDKLKELKAPLTKRMEFALPNEQMERMLRKREIVVPEVSNEEPVFLLIISEGGMPIFSQSFDKDQNFKDHLFGGFLSAINSFISEMFSEGLDRVIFGDQTILVNSVSPFFVCYVFKGQSYSAQKRIKSFVEEIQVDTVVWQTFEKSYRVNKEVQLRDVPSLEFLIKQTFIDLTT
ncbi:MAG: tetratricopeptide repeat protein [Promethearchaeota archaeon]|jgi:tetratricopeptide (TPR) repeat protein